MSDQYIIVRCGDRVGIIPVGRGVSPGWERISGSQIHSSSTEAAQEAVKLANENGWTFLGNNQPEVVPVFD